MTEPDTTAISTIIILDTYPVARQGLAILLRERFERTRILDAKNLHELQESSPEIEPTLFIVVINPDFEEEEGSNPIFEIKANYPKALMILYGEETKPELVISYFKSGIDGYLSKQKDLTELVTCINTVITGKRYVSAEHMDFLFGYLVESHKAARKQDLLTPRQNEVAKYLIQGLSTSSIAEKTGLHISTISTFKTAIFSKLGIDNILKLKQILETGEN